MPPTSKTYHPDARVILGIVLESIEDDNSPFVSNVRPTEISVFRNSYIEADTFSVTFNATDMPLTPETLRAVGVEIYLFHKESLRAQPESITKGADTDLFLYGDEIKPSIVGIADMADVHYDDTGRFVTITGRDYTCLYLDQDWDATYRVDYVGRLDEVIQNLADKVAGSAGIMNVKVELGPEAKIIAALKFQTREQSLDENLPRVGKSEGRANRKGLTFPNKANFWEVMLGIAVRYGFILFVKGTDIVLTTPKTYIKGRTSVTAMAWGRNLHDIHLSRKLGKERVPTIEVRSWDEEKQQVVKGQYPPEGEARRTAIAEKVSKKQQAKTKRAAPPKKKKRKKGQNANALGQVKVEVQQFTVHGITSKKQLTKIAELAYFQRGQSEQTVQISTSDLTDLKDKPILDISSGDAIAVKFEPFNSDLVEERLEEELLNRGYEREDAAKIAAKTEMMNAIREPMRVEDATIDFSLDEGITITITARNFVNIAVSGEKA